MKGKYTFSYMGFTYVGEWDVEPDKGSSKIMHEIFRDGEFVCHYPHSPYTFPNQSEVESFINNKLISDWIGR